jgi:hypothetical protein
MEIRVSVTEGDSTELDSLNEWLRNEPELAGRIKTAASPPQPGELGALAEALVVAVGSGGAISVLAGSLKAWLSLPHRSDIRIKVDGGGRSVDIDAKRIDGERLDSIIRRVLDPGSDEE